MAKKSASSGGRSGARKSGAPPQGKTAVKKPGVGTRKSRAGKGGAIKEMPQKGRAGPAKPATSSAKIDRTKRARTVAANTAPPGEISARARRAGQLSSARPTLAQLQAELRHARARIAELEQHAHVDVLLDILNRRGFERELHRAIAYVKRYHVSAALLYGDVDGLKPINDQFGHAAGDAYLRGLAKALVGHVRQSDTVARLGGDEFAILLWNITEADAAIKARGLEAMADTLEVPSGKRLLKAGLSIGLAMLQPLDDAAAALERADRQMYARKSVRKAGPDAAAIMR